MIELLCDQSKKKKKHVNIATRLTLIWELWAFAGKERKAIIPSRKWTCTEGQTLNNTARCVRTAVKTHLTEYIAYGKRTNIVK